MLVVRMADARDWQAGRRTETLVVRTDDAQRLDVVSSIQMCVVRMVVVQDSVVGHEIVRLAVRVLGREMENSAVVSSDYFCWTIHAQSHG